jgi:hypothetical protein
VQSLLVDDGRELRGLRGDEIGELLRRAVVGAGAHRGDVLPDVFTLQHEFYLLIERLHDLSRAGFGQEHAEPRPNGLSLCWGRASNEICDRQGGDRFQAPPCLARPQNPSSFRYPVAIVAPSGNRLLGYWVGGL